MNSDVLSDCISWYVRADSPTGALRRWTVQSRTSLSFGRGTAGHRYKVTFRSPFFSGFSEKFWNEHQFWASGANFSRFLPEFWRPCSWIVVSLSSCRFSPLPGTTESPCYRSKQSMRGPTSCWNKITLTNSFAISQCWQWSFRVFILRSWTSYLKPAASHHSPLFSWLLQCGIIMDITFGIN